MKFHAGPIWNQPWAGNRAGNANLSLETCQGHQKLKNLEKWKNSHEMHFPVNFLTLKINFRSADAANHFSTRPREVKKVTRRAYIPKI